ncbi:AraC family transcriptional regulator [uncultured Lacinutrix sp.]|uniref:AraC family transcriptional regulator n=1 Tax=uncultured Lacinutrix sp. TaxID=574032 RepID=UPI00261222D8|nr:AraC family transcriptional regulator [uncultured Lacinutrix sp.]
MKLTFFAFLFFFLGYSQKNESFKLPWHKKVLEFYRVNNDSAIFYSKKMQMHANSPCEQMYALAYEANSIYFKRECDSSKKLSLRTLSKIEQQASILSDSCYFFLKYNVLGRIVYAEKCLGNYHKALEYISKCRVLNEHYSQYSKNHELVLNYKSALIYIKLGQYKKAIALLNKIKSFPHEAYNKLTHSSIYVALGDSYLKFYEKYLNKSFLDSARVYYKKHYELSTQIESQVKYTQKLYNIKKGIISSYNSRYDSSLYYLRKAKSINLIEQKHFTNQEIDFYMSEAFHNLNKFDSSIYYANQFLKKYNNYPGNNNLLLKTHNILASSFNENKQYNKAYEHSSIALDEFKKIGRLKVNGIEKLNLINLKKIHNENQVFLNKKNIKWGVYKVLLTLLVIVLLVFIYRNYIYKKMIKSNNLLSVTNELIVKKDLIKGIGQSKISINEDIVHKIIKGLEQLEKEKEFLNDDFNLPYIAKKLNSNTSYVSKVINHYRGKSFKQYINNLRIEYIMKELKEKPSLRKFSIDAISKDLGYSNASSFSKIFKKNTGVNPSDFIKELNKNDNKA